MGILFVYSHPFGKRLSLQYYVNKPLRRDYHCNIICFNKSILTLKTARKPISENVVYLCRLLNILANFSNLLLHTGKQCGPRSDCS